MPKPGDLFQLTKPEFESSNCADLWEHKEINNNLKVVKHIYPNEQIINCIVEFFRLDLPNLDNDDSVYCCFVPCVNLLCRFYKRELTLIKEI